MMMMMVMMMMMMIVMVVKFDDQFLVTNLFNGGIEIYELVACAGFQLDLAV